MPCEVLRPGQVFSGAARKFLARFLAARKIRVPTGTDSSSLPRSDNTMPAQPTAPEWEFLAIDLQPGEMVLQVLNRLHGEGWEYDRVDPAPCATPATLHLKRRAPGAALPSESQYTSRSTKAGVYHPHARRWTVADDEIVRNHSAREAARLLQVSIATIYVRRHTLGVVSQRAS